ncbi:MAG TPA: sigma-54 dependent transcriptional regulator [Candidatus Acidoferrales bacterium]|nr:sigma-54 dependent transcriptional regulator [Candidatus Acidoferrales bacterium]
MNTEPRIRFLIVDDQQSIRRLCMTIGASLGFACNEAESAEAALAMLDNVLPDIVLVDLRMAQMSGLEFLAKLKQQLPRTEVAIMTGYGSIESAVQAMKLGAYDYITKPFRVEEIKLTLQRMADKVHLVLENEYLKAKVETEGNLAGIVGAHRKIQDVLRMVSRLKDTRVPVLITGESGTGKELVARAIHFRGEMPAGPFVAVDCGSLAPTLIESELFGYEKGAFTGASKSRRGLFQEADGGTLFLDEIGELPQDLQAKLLRVLEEKEVRPLGSNRSVKVNVRIIAATNRDLERAYKEGGFRKDLFFRLNVITVHLPPLRERKSDIPLLVQWFLDRLSEEELRFTTAAMAAMMNYDWPGNVRELRNAVEHAATFRNGPVIDLAELPESLRSEQALAPSRGTRSPEEQLTLPVATDLEEIERKTIQRVFDQVGGDKVAAQKLLGISRATLYRKLKRYNIRFRIPERPLSAEIKASQV